MKANATRQVGFGFRKSSRRDLYTRAMNYRHAYHAGNFADVLKHVVLSALVDALKAKPTPFAVIDTHAGSGCYALEGKEAEKTGEWRDGIGRLLFPDVGPHATTGGTLPPLLRHWLDGLLALPGNEQGLKFYPAAFNFPTPVLLLTAELMAWVSVFFCVGRADLANTQHPTQNGRKD